MQTGTKPTVVLLDWTMSGKEMASLAWKVMQEDITTDIEAYMNGGADIDTSKFDALKKESLGTPMEFIHMVWYISNVSRGFTHQLVRHRVGWSFAQQSMRVVPKFDFYDEGLYHIPPNTRDVSRYNQAMAKVQEAYRELVLCDEPEDAEVARGVLPTNVFTTIMAATNYRAWKQMVQQRLCTRVQGEFREVVNLMIEEVRLKLGKDFADVQAPCEYDAMCKIPSQWEKCGKENTKDHRQIIR